MIKVLEKTGNLSGFQPLHDQEPRCPTIVGRFRFRSTRDGCRFIKVAQAQAGSKQSAHIRAQGTMMIDDPNAAIFNPLRAFLEVVVNGIMQASASAIFDPAAVHACSVEAGEICDKQSTAWFQ